jgi:cell division protein FtsB
MILLLWVTGGFGMSFWRGVKRRLKALVAPTVFLAVGGFFVWHTIHGERGTLARERRIHDIATAQAGLEAARADHAAVQRRVNGLRADGLDRDQLEERARALLNLSQPGEVVVPYAPGQRLY